MAFSVPFMKSYGYCSIVFPIPAAALTPQSPFSCRKPPATAAVYIFIDYTLISAYKERAEALLRPSLSGYFTVIALFPLVMVNYFF